MHQDKDLIYWVIISTIFGLSTSSIIAVKKNSTVGQLLLAAALGCVLSAACPFIFMALGMHMAWAIPAAATLGLLVFGIFAWVEVNERKVPNINVWEVWRNLPGRKGGEDTNNPGDKK